MSLSLNDFAAMFLQSTVILGVAWGVMRFQTHAGLRVWTGRMALLATLLCAVVSITPKSPGFPPTRERSRAFAETPWAFQRRIAPVSVSVAPILVDEPVRVDPRTMALPSLASVYGMGVMIGLFTLGLGLFELHQTRRRSRLVQSDVFDEECRRLGVRRVGLRELPGITPFVAGVFRPKVFIPTELDRDSESFRMLVRHELAHIAHRDLHWSMLGRLMAIAFWFQPLVGFVNRSLRAASELECDRRVLALGAVDTEYARCLVDCSAQSAMRRNVPAIAASDRATLADRVAWVLVSSAKLGGASRRAKVGVLLAFVLALGGAVLGIAGQPISLGTSLEQNVQWTSYATTVQITRASGVPNGPLKAWLLLLGRYGKERNIPLKVDGDRISIPKFDGLQPEVHGRLVVQQKGAALTAWRVWPSRRKLTALRLEPPTGVRGRLLDERGKPVVGQSIYASMAAPKVSNVGDILEQLIPALDGSPYAISTTTNEKGEYQLEGFRPNTAIRLALAASRFGQLGQDQDVITGKVGISKAPDRRLQPEAVLEGRVVRDGVGVPGVSLGIQDCNGSGPSQFGAVVTGPDGRYRFGNLLTGEVNVIVDDMENPAPQWVGRALESVALQAGKVTRVADITLEPGVLIQGVVRDRAGKPLPKIQVGIYGPAHPMSSGWVQTAWSDANGRYRFRVPAGKQHIYLMDSRFDASERDLEIRTAATVNFVARPATVSR